MDNNDNDERIMEEIIVGGANDNEEDITADSENNDDLEYANAEGSNKVYISLITYISINSITRFLYILINLCRFMENCC
jgi:hypothetical protein